MSKLYNTQGEIATNLNDFFLKACKNLSKVHLNILPFIIIGMIDSESIITNDIIKKLKGHFQFVKNESNQRRLRRFFNSDTFNIYHFYDSIIRYIILNFKPKSFDDPIHISFDHCFCKSKFTILCFSFRIGKHAFPLWFRCFKGKHDSEAFISDTIIKGIDYTHDLFKDTNYKLVFLADRFFISSNIMKHIDYLKHTYVIRTKTDIKILHYDKKEGHNVRKHLSDIPPMVYHSKLLYNIPIFEAYDYKVNIAISKNYGVDEAWYLLTNGDPARAIKFYGYRWSIECFFKNEKSNGFYLESTNIRNVKAFTTMFGLSCVALIWLTILGSYYSKTKNKNNNFITDIKKYNGIPKRIISLFNVGLIYFNLAYNSIKYFYLNFSFILYDV